MELRVGGSGAYEFVLTVLDAAARGSSVEDIRELFDGATRSNADALLEQLEQHRLLLADDEPDPDPPWETPLELFHWSAGASPGEVAQQLAKAHIAVIGVNEVSAALVSTLRAAGIGTVEVVNYPFLCNLRMLDESGEVSVDSWPADLGVPVAYDEWSEKDRSGLHCLVATSDFGGLDLMRVWNRYSLERDIPFLPVVLQDLVGYVGPLSVPGRAACFECAYLRQNANLDQREEMRSTEPLAFFGQGVTAAYHPALPAALGQFAALEISRLLGAWGSPRVIGALIEVDLLAPGLVCRPVLKLPRCPVCGEASARSTTEIFGRTFLPGTHEPHG
ncbi:bacteriocin biosynthesis cyclodehydratase domain-containing protein [Cryptosporangium aurantiacum]|uniref:Bacteriocin biosynthesis cyclodehydratase domain-containing protein n=2 Tax=Cryptosporangium aurantiacum TaxID=134849 RepID=A0A1M7RGL7_9ACTN|nr:bacteriocin biosynthesis cyclodehydratase domain-containing protein [Cryptosporangium aurantiacum]